MKIRYGEDTYVLIEFYSIFLSILDHGYSKFDQMAISLEGFEEKD